MAEPIRNVRDWYIGRYPAGFLDLLNAKAQGETPHSLADQVVAMVDLFPFLCSQKFTVSYGTTNAINAVGGWPDTSAAANCTVPQTEYWYVWNLTAYPTAALGAGTTLRIAPAVRDNQALNYRSVGPASPLSSGAGLLPIVSGSGFWMRPGETGAVFAENVVVGVAPTVNVIIAASKFRI